MAGPAWEAVPDSAPAALVHTTGPAAETHAHGGDGGESKPRPSAPVARRRRGRFLCPDALLRATACPGPTMWHG